jgi:hypothetical protein
MRLGLLVLSLLCQLIFYKSWGGQSWPQPPFRRLDRLDSRSAGTIARPTIVNFVRKGKLPERPQGWLIVPGVRVGPLTASTGRADLDRIFGVSQVTDRAIDTGDGSVRAGTIVHPSDASESLGILWVDDSRTRPDQVILCYGRISGPCRWHTVSGIGIETSLQELEKANGRPFLVLGFERDFAGTVLSWQGGNLAREFEGRGRLVLRLSPKSGEELARLLTPEEEAAILADRIASDHPAIRKVNPVVNRILFVFPAQR